MFLGIDLGTTNIKAVLVNDAQQIIAEASEALSVSRPQPGWSEQNPDDWVKAAQTALSALRQSAGRAFDAVEAISFSGQMHGLVALDAALKPLRPCILHNDGRAHAEAAALNTRHPDLAEQTGVLCMPGFVAPKIRWLQRQEPEIDAAIRCVMMPKDYLRLWFCGEAGTDVVDAAGAWLLDEKRRRWSEAVLSALELQRAALPELHESIAVTGVIRPAIADEFGLPRGTVIVAGAGDAAAGSIGLGQIEAGDAFISLGTASQLFVTMDRYQHNVPALVHAFAHALPNRWFQMAAMLNGASALAWWAAICGQEPGALIAETAGLSESGTFFLPYLMGERTPHNNPHLRGTFHGMDGGTSRAGMTHAVLEAVAFTLADARDALETGESSILDVGIAGGGARSDIWCGLIADCIDRPVRRFKDANFGPAFGAARLARIGARGETPSSVCIKPPVETVFTPRVDAVMRQMDRLAAWRDLQSRVNGR